MTDNQDHINKLLLKLEVLLKRQEAFSEEVNLLRDEMYRLKISQEDGTPLKEEVKETPLSDAPMPGPRTEETTPALQFTQPKAMSHTSVPPPSKAGKTPKGKSDWEKFIGENLINKIGIAITVIGVAIGAKYSIENELISPLTRIILGYLAGIGLLGIGMKLKKNYENYSAVLVSGAMTIMYFITFSAYSFYDQISQPLAFILMLIFTAFTVVAAINYNRQLIAHIGLVGAYAVPFLLSDGSGRIAVLLSYMAIINIGILVIAFKKYWKALYYVSFSLTWFIYFLWYATDYQTDMHYALALTFLFVFFIIFYLTFLAYKLIQKEKFHAGDVVLIMLNSFIFYAFGYSILNGHETGEQLLGVFTLFNGVVHFIASTIIHKQKLADKNLFFLILGMVLVFITIAIPVQLDGNWVTLLWAGEAALLFWIGRTKKIAVYEKLSYPLMLLALFSIVHDWFSVYDGYMTAYPETRINTIFNINFLTSILFIAAFIFINTLNQNKKYPSALKNNNGLLQIMSYIIPTILVFTAYYAIRVEISTYWNQLLADSGIKISTDASNYEQTYRDYDLIRFKIIWVLNYSLLFLSVLALLNLKKIKSTQLGYVNLVLNLIAILVFLVQGLYALSQLRDNYLWQDLNEYFEAGAYNLVIRYISLAFFALILVVSYQYTRQKFMTGKFHKTFGLVLHISILWVASSELINWMDIRGSAQSYKLGLSILWGVYSLLLIAFGIWKNKKYLRIGAIVLFAVTLIKLFFYDIAALNTIAKTVVFVSLGVLLLTISFLYNKYKNLITDEIEN